MINSFFNSIFVTSGLPSSVTSGSKKIRVVSAILFCFLFLSNTSAVAQQPVVSATVDTTAIKIGEQLSYTITVETDVDNLVVFPEGQTFNPLEVVESLSTDTTSLEDRYRLIKEYSLTQFDSGSYTIPQQRILINDTPYFTDSLSIEVANVVVDTTKQKMYPIKPAMEVPSGFSIPMWVWLLLAFLLLGALVFYLLRRRKRKQEAEQQLPPYERAIFELQQLDQSHLLENRQTKEYYSKLTEAVRRYIEDEVHLRAMESTTSELIRDLEVKMENGELKLSRQTIDDLKIILQRADLAKFANSRPDVITARGDRSKIEHVINDTKAAIPEPTEEELLLDEVYRQEQVRRRKRRKIALAVAAGLALIVLAGTLIVTTRGYTYLQEMVLGNPTKELMEGDWLTSEYGDPEVTVTTPRVLRRGEIDLPVKTQEMMVGSETFIDGSLEEDIYVVLTTVRYQQGAKFDLNAAVDGIYNNLEQQGAKNIIVKDEEFTTLEGVKGIKVFGSLEMQRPGSDDTVSKEYSILNFGERGGFQQITVIYDEEDEYAEEIAGRIINSVEFNSN